MTLDERADYIFIRVCYVAIPVLVYILIVALLMTVIIIWLWNRRHKLDYIINTIYTPTLKTTLILSGGRLSIVSHKDYPLIQKIRLEGKLYMIVGKQVYNGMLIRDAFEYTLEEWSE